MYTKPAEFFFGILYQTPLNFLGQKLTPYQFLGSLEGRESVPPSHFRFRVWEADRLLNQLLTQKIEWNLKQNSENKIIRLA